MESDISLVQQTESPVLPPVIAEEPVTASSDLAFRRVDPITLGKLFWPYALAPVWLGLLLFWFVSQGSFWISIVMLPVCAAIGSIGMLYFLTVAQKLLWSLRQWNGTDLQCERDPKIVLREFALPALLTVLTMGLYAPWFMTAWLRKSQSTVKGLGTVSSFEAEPDEVAIPWGTGLLLTVFTLGAYGPWWWVRTLRWRWQHTRVDEHTFAFTVQPGELLLPWLKGLWLSIVSLGIYTPWFLSTLWQWEARAVR